MLGACYKHGARLQHLRNPRTQIVFMCGTCKATIFQDTLSLKLLEYSVFQKQREMIVLSEVQCLPIIIRRQKLVIGAR